MHPPALTALLKSLGKLPGLGPRSAQRAALGLLATPEKMTQLATALHQAAEQLGHCTVCGNLAEKGEEGDCLCPICTNPQRDTTTICVVEGVADVWALERSGSFSGTYHVLGGTVSALHGTAPEDLSLGQLEQRLRTTEVQEVILALGASLEGQTTGHLVAMMVQRLRPEATLTSLAKGMPVGASVDYLDEGTLGLALAHRQRV